MRVFVTGASGTIGSVVVADLIAGGHEVLALARSDASEQSLAKPGVSVLRGHLDDLDTLRAGAVRADGVIHLAFGHDDLSAAGIQKSMAQEAATIETFGAALEGSGKPFVVASGTPGVPGRASTEKDPPLTEGLIGARGRNAQAVVALAARGVRSSVVRLPRSVHAQGERSGCASMLVDSARRTGISSYVGDGTQRWPAVHRLDAAPSFSDSCSSTPTLGRSFMRSATKAIPCARSPRSSVVCSSFRSKRLPWRRSDSSGASSRRTSRHPARGRERSSRGTQPTRASSRISKRGTIQLSDSRAPA